LNFSCENQLFFVSVPALVESDGRGGFGFVKNVSFGFSWLELSKSDMFVENRSELLLRLLSGVPSSGFFLVAALVPNRTLFYFGQSPFEHRLFLVERAL
jgi:hypothetical protein